MRRWQTFMSLQRANSSECRQAGCGLRGFFSFVFFTLMQQGDLLCPFVRIMHLPQSGGKACMITRQVHYQRYKLFSAAGFFSGLCLNVNKRSYLWQQRHKLFLRSSPAFSLLFFGIFNIFRDVQRRERHFYCYLFRVSRF